MTDTPIEIITEPEEPNSVPETATQTTDPVIEELSPEITDAGILVATPPEEEENPEAEKTESTALVPATQYIVISFSVSSAPTVFHAASKRDMVRMVQELHAANDQQFLFVVRGGELGTLYRTKSGLAIKFEDSGDKAVIPTKKQAHRLEDGWIGE